MQLLIFRHGNKNAMFYHLLISYASLLHIDTLMYLSLMSKSIPNVLSCCYTLFLLVILFLFSWESIS